MGDILFLAHCIPFATGRSDHKRGFHILRHLAARSRVHLVAFADDREDFRRKDTLAGTTASRSVIWRNRRPGGAMRALMSGKPARIVEFEDSAMHRAVRGALSQRRIDTIYVLSSRMAQYVPEDAQQRIVLDLAGSEAERLRVKARTDYWPMRAWAEREARLLSRYERQIVERADTALVASAPAAPLGEFEGDARFRIVESGVDADYFDPGAPFSRVEPKGVLILLADEPADRLDIDDAAWFVDAILPHIRLHYPNVRLAIVGADANPRLALLGAADNSVIVVAGATDRRPWLAAASVVVAPGRVSGHRDGVLEAMAMARPVVASLAAASGIDHADTIRVGGGVSETVDQIMWVLSNAAAAEEMGRAARQRVRSRYRWQTCLTGLDGPPQRNAG